MSDQFSHMLSNDPAQPLGTASSGDAACTARCDHVHPMPTAAQVGAATPSAVSAAVAVETTARQSADTALNAAITSLQSAITSLQTAVANLPTTQIRAGTAAIPSVMLGGASLDVTVPLNAAFSGSVGTNYYAIPFIVGATVSVLGNLSVTRKTNNASSVVVTVKNTGLASISAGNNIEVIACAL